MIDAPQIIIDRDSVTIEGIQVQRPSRISRSQWQDFWAAAKSSFEIDHEKELDEAWSRGFEAGAEQSAEQ